MSWPTAELQDFCEIKGGGRLKLSGNDFVDDGFPAYGAGGMNGLLPVAEFDRDAVVLSAIGARCGKCFLAEGEWTSLANTQLIFPDPKTADVRFLWYQLNDEARWPRSGVAQPFIKPAIVKAHKVILPPLEEQKRIAGILDQADALRRLRARALDKINNLGQAIFHEMFCSSEQADDIPFPEVVYFQEGPGVRKWQFRDSGIKLINVTNIVNGELVLENTNRYLEEGEVAQKYRHFLLDVGDFVVASSGVTWGKIARVTEKHLPLCLNTSMIRLRPKDTRIVDEYLRAFVEMGTFRSQIDRLITGSAQPNFGPSHLKQINIPVPRLGLQKAFEAKIAELRKQSSLHSAAAAAEDRLFSSLQQRAFRGDL